tara:strand:+ start:338 stop:682 length:345 start_codon:yes stop_codon:yes gene_type:complete
MEGTLKVESGEWNQVQDDLEHSDMPWLVKAHERTITFDAFDLAWCVLTEFRCTQHELSDNEQDILVRILVAIEDEFLDHVKQTLFTHFEERIGCAAMREYMDEWLSQTRALWDT